MLVRRYHQDLQRPGFQHDTAQEIAVRNLQRVYDQLLEARRNADSGTPVKKIGLFSRLTSRRTNEPVAPAIKGLYLWGGVGRGKKIGRAHV